MGSRRHFALAGRLHWIALAAVVGLGFTVATIVDLEPHVAESFFFSPSDPAYREDRRIDELFPSPRPILLSVESPDVESDDYFEKIEALGKALEKVPGVTAVRSVAAGPDDLDDARESPLWRRLLVAPDGRATNVVVLAGKSDSGALVRGIEAVVESMDAEGFRIRISGPPIIAEMIRRNLVSDFRHFNAVAAVVFGAMIAIVFRSFRIWLGALATCVAAVLLTLLVQDRAGMGIGILTANLTTIVFVIAQSHVVFLTANWRRLAKTGAPRERLVSRACRETLPGSFWSMATTALGFGSLLLVEAQPLRELGAGGIVGTIAAFVCAFAIHPPFLRATAPPGAMEAPAGGSAAPRSRPARHSWLVAAVIGATALLAPGIARLETDPSLLEYFDPDGRLRKDLEVIDRNGGSSPLRLVVRDADGAKLNTSAAYEKMWQLQNAIERDPAVGSTISLPVLMAESDRSPLSFFLRWEWLLAILERPEFDRVAASFVTKDRELGLFLLRMNEAGRSLPRVEIVRRIEATVREEGFEPVLVGGIYSLQGRIAELVATSLAQGLAGLLALFFVVALIAARRLRVALAMTASAALVPTAALGAMGWSGVPLDVISAPAANVAVGIAVDAMFHLVLAARRSGSWRDHPARAWAAARAEQSLAIVQSAVIVSAGFAFLWLSAFPPTRRFGAGVVLGAIVAAIAGLFVFPYLAGAGTRGPRSDEDVVAETTAPAADRAGGA